MNVIVVSNTSVDLTKSSLPSTPVAASKTTPSQQTQSQTIFGNQVKTESPFVFGVKRKLMYSVFMSQFPFCLLTSKMFVLFSRISLAEETSSIAATTTVTTASLLAKPLSGGTATAYSTPSVTFGNLLSSTPKNVREAEKKDEWRNSLLTPKDSGSETLGKNESTGEIILNIFKRINPFRHIWNRIIL